MKIKAPTISVRKLTIDMELPDKQVRPFALMAKTLVDNVDWDLNDPAQVMLRDMLDGIKTNLGIRGSRKKQADTATEEKPKKRRGRPKKKETAEKEDTPAEAEEKPKKRRGRPKGSKNKTKKEEVTEDEASGDDTPEEADPPPGFDPDEEDPEYGDLGGDEEDTSEDSDDGDSVDDDPFAS